MDKELKAKWVAALRSGKYKQAHEFLYDDNTGGYCCLGVLGCVLGRDLAAMSFKGDMAGDAYGFVYKLMDKGIAEKLALNMNDVGVEFLEIADYIEANL